MKQQLTGPAVRRRADVVSGAASRSASTDASVPALGNDAPSGPPTQVGAAPSQRWARATVYRCSKSIPIYVMPAARPSHAPIHLPYATRFLLPISTCSRFPDTSCRPLNDWAAHQWNKAAPGAAIGAAGARAAGARAAGARAAGARAAGARAAGARAGTSGGDFGRVCGLGRRVAAGGGLVSVAIPGRLDRFGRAFREFPKLRSRISRYSSIIKPECRFTPPALRAIFKLFPKSGSRNSKRRPGRLIPRRGRGIGKG